MTVLVLAGLNMRMVWFNSLTSSLNNATETKIEEQMEMLSVDRKFYDIYVKPFKPLYTNYREKEWIPDRDIEVVGVLITISTWDKLPVKVGVCLNGKGVDLGADNSPNILACLTTPANINEDDPYTIYVPVKGRVGAGTLINIYVWGHNMNTMALDFHSQVIIFYREVK